MGPKDVAKAFLLTTLGKMVLFTAFLVASLRCFMKAKLNRWAKILILVIMGLSFVGLGVYFTSNFFADTGVDDSVFYHLSVGPDGAGLMEYWKLIVSNIVFIGLILAFLYYAYDAFGEKKRLPARLAAQVIHWRADGGDATGLQKTKLSTALGMLFLGLSLIFNPITYNLYTVIKFQFGQV